ncbi:sulfite exporter TauE/SafE family protein [Nitrospirillum iridis]|uniref:Probable membrane transporter protein n=1 Tax=Nitrospirillum iridis TaxID=765888 RepID=A0A7X0AX62_9PROT|nr:sulfite exporter TauE/SafE family protein [Nitrospirillum iridis]MBB6251763.1 hypothetical protein [Nitrospirillum iridis]
MPIILILASGGVVGFTLGVVGGGGSILAVPLLLYVVGIPDPHVAIGTSALGVAVNAFLNLAQHARAGTVKWPCAAVFAATGVIGAMAGSTLGKAVDGAWLLSLFALVMIAVAVSMVRRRGDLGDPQVHITPAIAARLVAVGLATGFVSGFFGIGGGFLIVPGLMLGSGMTILNAVGSSLFSVGTFGLATAANYARSGLVDWHVAGWFILGGGLGGFAGLRVAVRLARRKAMLTRVFAAILVLVALYTLYRSVTALAVP